MKKILTSIACLASFASMTHADFLRAEVGIGGWNAQPKGFIQGESYGFEGRDDTTQERDLNLYAWVLVKHFVPVVPNLRVEYLDMTSEGKASGTLSGISIPTTTNTRIDMTQVDLIPYYNLLDNTFWITLDLGLDIKMIDVSYTVDPVVVGSDGYTSSDNIVLPLAYARGRVQIPTTDFGVEADVKYLEYDNNTLYDIRAKVDYTFDISPVVQPAIEVGYRMQKYQTDETSEIKLNLDYSGIYAGLMLRF